MPQGWDSGYPDPEKLRAEARRMADTYAAVLLEEIPRRLVRGIYLKGSALKRWDTPLDYVPEISDVDIHIYFHGDDTWRHHIGSISQAMRVQREVETRFLASPGRPIHIPRPQLMVMNKVMNELESFVHSPQSTVETLYGEEYPTGDYTEPDRIRRSECARIMADASYLEDVPLSVIDSPARYLQEVLRRVVWRVSPAGPRVIHISGADTAEAWSLNRTGVVGMLDEMGHANLARPYRRFYLAGWEYFLSGYGDGDAGRSALVSAVEVLTEAAEVARAYLAEHPESPVE